MGHLDPIDGEAIPVLLLRYRVSEVPFSPIKATRAIAIPTVLDSTHSAFYCPTPKVTEWKEGQTLNLSSENVNDYQLNAEIIHRYFDYQSSHLYQVGWITRSPRADFASARHCHLDLLEKDFIYFSELR